MSIADATEPTDTKSRVYVIRGVEVGTHNVKRGSGESGLLAVNVKYTDEATGITNVQTIELADDVMFNLAGQKVGAGYKGVALKNGKKLIIR